jgi:hypothetical protein
MDCIYTLICPVCDERLYAPTAFWNNCKCGMTSVKAEDDHRYLVRYWGTSGKTERVTPTPEGEE